MDLEGLVASIVLGNQSEGEHYNALKEQKKSHEKLKNHIAEKNDAHITNAKGQLHLTMFTRKNCEEEVWP